MLDIQFPGGITAPIPGLPLEMSNHKFGLRRQTPAIGQHTREILAEAGLTEAEIDDLGSRDIVVWPNQESA